MRNISVSAKRIMCFNDEKLELMYGGGIFKVIESQITGSETNQLRGKNILTQKNRNFSMRAG